MTTGRWNDDDRLLADLADAVRATAPTAEWIREIGDQVPLYRDLDVEIELAVLAYDSVLDPALVARNGGTAAYRTVLFQAGSAQLQIEVAGNGVDGQVMPAAGGVVSVDTPAGTVARADIDDMGCFSIRSMPAGIVRFSWSTVTGRVATDWVRLF